MQEAVKLLGQLGQMPSDHENISEDILEEYEALLKKIRKPICVADASQLILLFPKTSLFGLEWTLAHIFESVINSNDYHDESYTRILNQCPSEEWRETLTQRFRNRLTRIRNERL